MAGKFPDLRSKDLPLGPLRDKRLLTVGSADIDLGGGAIVQVVTAGNLTYVTLEGESQQTESSLSAGDFVNVAGVPVVLREIKGTSTVTEVIIGKL